MTSSSSIIIVAGNHRHLSSSSAVIIIIIIANHRLSSSRILTSSLHRESSSSTIIIAGNHCRLSLSSAVFIIIIANHRRLSLRILSSSLSTSVANIDTVIIANIYQHRREHRTHQPSSRTSDSSSIVKLVHSPTLAYHHRRFQPLRKTSPSLQQHEVDRSIYTTSIIMFSVYACYCGRLARKCYTLRDR